MPQYPSAPNPLGRKHGLFTGGLLAFVLALLSACGGGGGDGGAPSAAPAPVTSSPSPAPAPAAPGATSTSARMVGELPVNTRCPAADNRTLVYAGVECLVARTFGAPGPAGGGKLVVFLHGDVSAGGPADYMDSYAPAYATGGVVSVRLLRPGYYDSDGVASTGGNGSRVDTYTARNVEAVAYALAALRERYQASRLVVVGHSGGAAIAATILGKYPRLIDSAALMACPCDLRLFAPTWINSISPMDWASAVPAGTRVVSMTGSADTQVPASYTQGYVNALAARGIAAEQIAIPGATHASSTIFTAAQVQSQITALLQ